MSSFCCRTLRTELQSELSHQQQITPWSAQWRESSPSGLESDPWEERPTAAESLPPRPSQSGDRRHRLRQNDNSGDKYSGLAALGTSMSEAMQSPDRYFDETDSLAAAATAGGGNPPAAAAAMLSLPLDPLFAVSLQEAFGPPLDSSFLELLSTEEILATAIPLDLARQIFEHWRTSLQTRLCAKPDFLEPPPKMVVVASAYEQTNHVVREDLPRTILAPNAVAYYENQDLDRALRESSAMSHSKKVNCLIDRLWILN